MIPMRDQIEAALITAHQSSKFGRELSTGQVPLLLRNDLEGTAVAVQHLLFVVTALEQTVKRLADEIDALCPTS